MVRSPKPEKRSSESRISAVRGARSGSAAPDQRRWPGFEVSVGAGGTFAVAGNADVQTLSLGPDATSDVTGSLLLRAAAVADIVADVRDGRIISSSASGDSKHTRGLGVASEDAGVLLKYTYFGDTDLDGAISVEDFDRFVAGFSGEKSPAWASGDFDYSGSVNAADFSLLIDGFAGQGYSADLFAAVSDFARLNRLNVDLSAVPEPTAFAGIVGVAAACICLRRVRTSSARLATIPRP